VRDKLAAHGDIARRVRALPEDARLLILMLLNAAALAAAVRFVRRHHIRDWPQVVIDTVMIWYLVQYLSVALPGVLGVLSFGAMALVAVVLSIAMVLAPAARGAPVDVGPMSTRDRRVVLACLAILCALIAAHVFNVRYAPPTANDALTYHLPAAAQWLQTGRLGYFQTWFFNPANTYSPLAGSTFIAWLMAPMHSDIIARGVEAPALILIFFVLLQLCRALGASVRVSAIFALAGCCSRPLINQVFLAKDDLFVAAFFGVAVLAMTRVRPRDTLDPLRLGVAVGLLLATKYTALMCVPILLLGMRRDAIRRVALAVLVALLLCGPWYLRNWIVMGNPIFPIDVGPLRGMFTPARSDALRSLAGIWKAFTGYSGLPALALIALFALWLIAIARVATVVSRIRTEPITRIVTIGPPLMVGLFVLTSPYAEVRFIYPAVLLAFAAIAIAWPTMLVASGVACVMLGTSFIPASLALMIAPGLAALVVLVAVLVAIEFRSIALAALLLLGGGGFTYVYWLQYSNQYRADATAYWQMTYGPIVEAWKYVREETPSNSTIAYTNTYFVHPLLGANLDHRAVYVPTRHGVRTMRDLGHLDARVSGEQIVDRVDALIVRDPDRDEWLEKLRRSNATYLLIAKSQAGRDEPPELQFVRDQAAFQPVFANSAAAVYRIGGFASAGR
jgi:hypothetical protein